MLTLHTGGGREMMVAAKEAQQATKPDLMLLGVTVLTSLDMIGLREVGVTDTPDVQVARLAHLAVDSGLSGLVCSPL
jgi:orotidine-5'-phosphate decarboxylase